MTNEFDEIDEEAQSALRNVFWGVIRKGGTKEQMMKEFDSVVAQIFRPSASARNFSTDSFSPPAKTPSTPGLSGTSEVHRTRRGTSQETVEQFTDRALDTSDIEEGVGPDYSHAPPKELEASPGRSGQWERTAVIRPSGRGYEPYQQQRGVLGKGLEQWESERGTMNSISPGTTPLPSENTGESEDESPAEIADRIRGKDNEEGSQGLPLGSDKVAVEEMISRREAQKPRLVRRDQKGAGNRDIRRRIHDTYTGET